MIPNCMGCEIELFEAYRWSDDGYGVVLEGMGERKHIFIWVFDDKGNLILS